MAEWLTLLGQGGVIGVIAVWLWVERQRCDTERSERIAVSKANDTLRDSMNERMITALHDVTSALRDMEQSNEATRAIIEGVNNLLVAQSRGRRGSN